MPSQIMTKKECLRRNEANPRKLGPSWEIFSVRNGYKPQESDKSIDTLEAWLYTYKNTKAKNLSQEILDNTFRSIFGSAE